jgi:hypothetical protein
MLKLDKKKFYSEIIGPAGGTYEQDGVAFTAMGDPLQAAVTGVNPDLKWIENVAT